MVKKLKWLTFLESHAQKYYAAFGGQWNHKPFWKLILKVWKVDELHHRFILIFTIIFDVRKIFHQ